MINIQLLALAICTRRAIFFYAQCTPLSRFTLRVWFLRRNAKKKLRRACS